MNKLNLGCGADIQKGFDNVDIKNGFDANIFPYKFKDNTYSEVLVRQSLQMFDNPHKVLYELWRICKPNAIIEIKVPYWNSKGQWNDIQTKRVFSETTFKHFVSQSDKFQIESIYLRPSCIGKYLPFKKKLSLFISGIIIDMTIKLKVIKEKA
jgi:ubiquinone/menaquinone biosynthesis C-methylase UbiE